MQVVYHIGVHGTDGDRMLKTLLNNRDWFLKNRTEIVPPTRHRGVFEDAMAALNGGKATPEMEQTMQDAVLDTQDPRRVVFSTPALLGVSARVAGTGGLYPQAAVRVAALANLFPSATAEFFVAMRNPATLLTVLAAHMRPDVADQMLQAVDPAQLSWLAAMQRIAQGAQGRRLVVWCHEDVPLIWPEVVRMVGGMGADVPLAGALLYMHEILGDKGLKKLRGELSARDQMTIVDRRDIFLRELAIHALPGALDQTVDLPGWTQHTVDAVTDRYYADVAQIAALPGVEFVIP